MRKVYVQVNAEFSKNGVIAPLSLLWEDGRRFEIERLYDARPQTAPDGPGTCFIVRIRGRATQLYLEDGLRWYVLAR